MGCVRQQFPASPGIRAHRTPKRPGNRPTEQRATSGIASSSRVLLLLSPHGVLNTVHAVSQVDTSFGIPYFNVLSLGGYVLRVGGRWAEGILKTPKVDSCWEPVKPPWSP